MTPSATVSIETAVFACIISLLLGFFGNLIAMRKMFSSKEDLDSYKDTSSKAMTEMKLDQERIALDMRQKHESEMAALKKTMQDLCDSRRAACLPMLNNMSEMKADIAELSKLTRESHGKIERLFGLMERDSKIRLNGEV